MSYNLKDKVAIVTGSSAGLGRELANQLGKRGASIVMNGRNEERLNRVVSDFRQNGYDVHAIAADAGAPEQSKMIVDQALERFGRIDVLVNNAGGGMRGLFEEMSEEGIRTVLNNNLLSATYMTRYALPHIRESRGSIIFISSVAARFGFPVLSLYSMSKMALTALIQSLRIELKGSGVHLGIVYVGFVRDDPGKTIVGPDGSPVSGHSKPGYLAQSQEKVSKAVIRMIRRRKRKMTLSLAGKVAAFFIRLSPALVSFVISASEKRIRRIY
jgi:short-subunit dehydrogenase